MILIFALGISYSAISQNCCNEKCIKKLVKKQKKTRRLEKLEITFQIAHCYKGKSDSLAKYYFYLSSELAKGTSTCKNPDMLRRVLYISGISYFEIKEYKTAGLYLSKVIERKYLDSTIYYYYGLCNLNENKYKEALMSFEKQKELYPNVNAAMVMNCIQVCKSSGIK